MRTSTVSASTMSTMMTTPTVAAPAAPTGGATGRDRVGHLLLEPAGRLGGMWGGCRRGGWWGLILAGDGTARSDQDHEPNNAEKDLLDASPPWCRRRASPKDVPGVSARGAGAVTTQMTRRRPHRRDVEFVDAALDLAVLAGAGSYVVDHVVDGRPAVRETQGVRAVWLWLLVIAGGPGGWRRPWR